MSLFHKYQLIAESGLFDAAYYLAEHPELAQANVDPIIHYLNEGAAKGYRPSLQFDVDAYLHQCREEGQQPDNPLLHFIQRSGAQGAEQQARSLDAPPPPATAGRSRVRPVYFYRQHGLRALSVGADGTLHLSGWVECVGSIRNITVAVDEVELGFAECSPLRGDEAAPEPTVHRADFTFYGRLRTPARENSRLVLRLIGEHCKAETISFLLSLPGPARGGGHAAPGRASFEAGILMFLEAPTFANGPVFHVSDDLLVAGWAFAEEGLEEIKVLVDGKSLGSTRPRIARADVMAVFPEVRNSLRSGFELRIPRRDLAKGERVVEVLAHASDGSSKALSFAVFVEAAEPKGAEAYVRLLYQETHTKTGQLLERIGAQLSSLEKRARNKRDSGIKRLRQDVDVLRELYEALDAAPGELNLDGLQAGLENVYRVLGRRGLDAAQTARQPQAPQKRRSAALASLRSRFPPLVFPDSDKPKVSIVIPVFNQFFFTYQCLASLLRHWPAASAEVIVVDDASADETLWIKDLVQGVRLIRNRSNQGYIESCNRGASRARGEYLLLLNNDTLLTPGAVDELLQTFDDAKVGLAGSKLLYPNGQLQEAGCIVWRDATAWNYGRLEDPESPDFNYRRQVDYCSGASIMIPRAIWDELGGFDRHYRPAYYEDADLCLRIRQAGYDVVYQPLSVVIHCEGISSGKDPEKGIKAYQLRNQQRFLKRWHSQLQEHRPRGVQAALERDRGCRKRALFIDATTPTPDQDAGSTVAMAHMKILQAMGFRVTFIPIDNFALSSPYTRDLQRSGIEAIYHPHYSDLEDFLQRRPGEFDLIYLHRYTTAEEALPILRRRAPGVPILFNNADLHYLRKMREVGLNPSPAQYEAIEQEKARELEVVRAVDCTIVCNSAEIDILRQEAPGARLHYLPWVIEAERRALPSFSRRAGFMFLGGFGHPPNLDAIQYFVSFVMPLVRARMPGVALHIYGSKMPEEVFNLAAEDILIEGFVPDLSAAFDRHRVSIAPLRFGAGFKGKLATSLAHGVPVVGSSVAVEGTGTSHGAQVLVADDPESFAAELTRVYSDRKLWARMSGAGRRYVIDNLSFDRGRQHFADILTELQRTDLIS